VSAHAGGLMAGIFWMQRILLLIIGALAIVAVFFFGTLFLIDVYRPNSATPEGRNAIRAQHAAQIKAGLEGYRKAHGAVPIFPDNDVDDLKPALVAGGFVPAIPSDPLPGWKYRYASVDGKAYGLLFKTEPTGANCLSGTRGYGYWADPPACPF
jgi:hypothetical protein